MSSLDIKKIKNSLDNLYLEKQKIEKGEKTKKNKGKGKAKLKMEGDNVSIYIIPSFFSNLIQANSKSTIIFVINLIGIIVR